MFGAALVVRLTEVLAQVALDAGKRGRVAGHVLLSPVWMRLPRVPLQLYMAPTPVVWLCHLVTSNYCYAVE